MTSSGVLRPLVRARFAQFEQRLFGARENLVRIVLGHQRAVHQLLRGHGDAPQRGLVAHDPDVAVEVRDLRQAVVERDQVAQAVHRFQLVIPSSSLASVTRSMLLAARMQFGHAREDAAMLLEGEIVVVQDARDLDETGIVEQHRAEDEPLGIDVCGKAFLEGDGCGG